MADSSKKRFTAETHRAATLDETLARIEPHLSSIGISRVANVTGLDRIGIPVVMVVRPNSRSVVVSQGKGLSLRAARVSGLMESIETWHAERPALPLRYETWAEISREAATANVSALPATSLGSFSPDRKSLWVEAHDLVRNEAAWLPYELVHTDYTHPVTPQYGCFACSTNGLASGNHLLEASCHAICEVIERDSISVWHHLPSELRQTTRIVPDTIADAGCQDAMARIAGAGFELAVWETTTDVGVASFRCIIVDGSEQDGHIGIGDGCHVDPAIAVLRSLTEAVQTRMTYISGARDDMAPDEFTPQAMAHKTRFARGLIREGPPQRNFEAAPGFVSDDFADDLHWLLGRLDQAGCPQVLRVDLSRPEIGLAVVRIVIPGLEAPHDDYGYVPGPRARRAMGQPS
jgi:YcaO-like protein with predicted kinase domain